MTTRVSFHNVTHVRADSVPTSSTPLSITALNAAGEALTLTLFLADHALACRIAAAINGAVEPTLRRTT